MATIGATLREARERRGLTIEQVAQDTRISARFLEALEAEAFELLPAPVYVRGFLRSYASYLKLDPQPLLDQLVGGEYGTAGGPAEFVGGPRLPRGGQGAPARGRVDPFRPAGGSAGAGAFVPGPPRGEDDWAPEPPGGREDPGPAPMEPPSYYEEATPDPYGYERARAPYRRAAGGVLLERPTPPGEAGLPRAVLIGAVAAIGLVVLLAVVALARGGGGGGSPAAPAEEPTRALTPAAVVPVGSPTARAGAGASPTGTVTGTATVGATATPGTATPTAGPGTPTATPQPGATPTPSPAGTATPTATRVPPTATPTPIPPTPTPTPLPPHPSGLSACNLNVDLEKCGPSPARVICYPPFPAEVGVAGRSNWFVDVSRTYPLPPGWREVWVEYGVSVGPLIAVGQAGCE